MFQIWEFLINRIKGLILYILVIKIIENIQFEVDFFYIWAKLSFMMVMKYSAILKTQLCLDFFPKTQLPQKNFMFCSLFFFFCIQLWL